jgi:hypothetical protein
MPLRSALGKDDFHDVPRIPLARTNTEEATGKARSARVFHSSRFMEEGQRLGLIRDAVERFLTGLAPVQYHLRRRTSMPRSWPSHSLNVAALVTMLPDIR